MPMRNNILIGCALLTATLGTSSLIKAAPPATKATARTAAVTISSPKNNSQVTSPLTVSGRAAPGSPVKVSVEAVYDSGRQNIKNTNVRPARNGTWKTAPITLQMPQDARNGRFEITASQMASGNTPKKERAQSSATVTVKLQQMKIIGAKPKLPIGRIEPNAPVVEVKPDTPEILPLDPVPVITSPTRNSSVSSPLVVRGTARKTNDRVMVDIKATFTGGEMLLKQHTPLTVDNNGQWRAPATELWLPYGAKNAEFKITASQAGRKSQVIVKPASSIPYELAKPTITSPARNARIALPGTVRIQGTGIPGHTIDVAVRGYWGSRYGNGNRQAGHGTAVVGANGQWSVGIAVEQVVPGGDTWTENYYKISAKQAFPGNKFSAVVTSTFNSTGN